MNTMNITAAPVRSIRDQVIKLAKELPAAPQVFTRLTEILQRPQCDMEEVAELVALDPAIAGQVLATANSVYFRGEQGVSTVRDAAVRLGVVEVHRVVGVTMAANLFAGGVPLYRMSGDAMWSNAVAGALAMEALARHAGVDTHEAYTVGLLRQVGKLAMARVVLRERWDLCCPDEVDLIAWERVRFDLTNLEATAEILSAWKMPARIVSGIRHAVDLSPSDGSRFPALLHLSGWIVEQLGLHLPAEHGLWKFSASICDLAGVREDLVQSSMDETATEWAALRAMVK